MFALLAGGLDAWLRSHVSVLPASLWLSTTVHKLGITSGFCSERTAPTAEEACSTARGKIALDPLTDRAAGPVELARGYLASSARPSVLTALGGARRYWERPARHGLRGGATHRFTYLSVHRDDREDEFLRHDKRLRRPRMQSTGPLRQSGQCRGCRPKRP